MIESVPSQSFDERAPSPELKRDGPRSYFFAISPLKLVAMSVATFGLYQIFWIYAQWVRLKRRRERGSWPLARTFFASISNYWLFKIVKDTAGDEQIDARFSPLLLATGWAITTFLARFSSPWAIISLGAVVFLVPVQKTMNEVNRKLTPGHEPNSRFGIWEIVVLVVGGPLVAMGIIGLLLGVKG